MRHYGTEVAPRILPPVVALFLMASVALPADTNPGARLLETYASSPLSFERVGQQIDNASSFITHGNGYGLYLAPSEIVFSLSDPDATRRPTAAAKKRRPAGARHGSRPSVLRMRFRGGNPATKLTAIDELPSKSHYFVGSDPQKWRTNVSQYARVKYQGVYPGIDVIFHGDQRQLEYDLVIAPGADPRVVRLEFEGGKGLRVDAQGNLVVRMKGGQEIRQLKPIVYQEVDGGRRLIGARYALRGRREVGFEVAAYDATRPLVIDPILAYATYLGGNSPGINGGTDVATSIAVDTQGNMYVAGISNSIDYPVVNPIPGRPTSNPNSRPQGFLTKLNAAGIPVYSSFLGDADALAIAADGQGNAYLTGTTAGIDFPLTPNAFQTQYGDGTGVALETAYLMKVNPSGSGLLYSSYLGGSISVGGSPGTVDDVGTAIAVDAAGNAYVAGLTSSANFPTTPGAHQRQNPGEYSGFVTKINPALAGPTSLVYSTYLGGNFSDLAVSIAVDPEGNAFITGSTFSTDFPTTVNAAQRQRGGSEDAFVTELDGAGAVLYSTYLGGSGSDRVSSIALDAGRNAWVAGDTDSTNFPTTPNAAQQGDPDFAPSPFRNNTDAFVAKINPGLAGSASLPYSTYLGGNDRDHARGIALDGAGNAYVTGLTNSTNFPPTGSVPRFTVYVTKLDPTGAIVSSTGLRIGGLGRGIAASDIGDVYVTGNTATTTGFATPGAFQPTYGGGASDAFVAKLCDCDRPAMTGHVPSFPASGNGWNMNVEVSERDGIVLRDVVLGTRYLAEKISVPYYSLKTVKDGQTFFEASASQGSGLELRPNDGAATVGASRFVGLKQIEPTEFYSPLVIEGTYLIDNISPQGKSCLRIAQRYEFYPAIDEDEFPDRACESSRTAPPPLGTLARLFDGLTCARFNPIVKYDLCAQEGETLESINIPERFHFQVEQPPPVSNLAAHLLIRDGDQQLPPLYTVIGGNPLPNEIVRQPISFGFSNAGTADNFHQKYALPPGEEVKEPAPPPGCPECVHIHWRWGQWQEFPQGLPPGRPVIPLGSNQSVQFGIVRAEPGEEHPPDGFERFANGEPAINTDNVFWYSAIGHQAADAFFTHGLFFSPNYARQEGFFAVLFADDANPGATTITAIDPALAGQLPSGFTVFESTAIDISTPGPTGSGPIIVSVGVPTVDDPNVFSRLRIFHREGGMLVDRTILPPDTPASDFDVRTLYARVDSLSPFVVALASDQPPSNRPPIARCKDVQLTAGSSCSAAPTATDVDAGSSDPDGDPITLAHSPAGPFGLGSHAVNLTATDPNAGSSSCQAMVTVLDQTSPTVSCPGDKAVANDAGLCSATVDPGLPTATDACSAASVVGVRSDGQSSTGAYPVGTTVITWTASDSSGNQASCAQRVAVADLQAPVISEVSVDKPSLWPPNHKMVDVAVSYDVVDNCDPTTAVSCALGVVSNEPVDGLGDGDTAPDWEILDSQHVRLRSERAGSGTGRVYTISVTCGDSRGHSSTRAMDVVVPKSQK